jgi:glutamate/tyrosine decarboxylase-like PLP-dependent enzyme
MLDFTDTGPDAALFPDRRTRSIWDAELGRYLAEAAILIHQRSVAPRANLSEFRDALQAFDFSTQRSLGELLPWTIEQLSLGVTQVTHPRYFGLFNPAPTFPAQCADRIVATFNPQLATWTTSPVAIEIERHVIRAVARRVGLPEAAAGHFTTGGSEANYTALICALTRASFEFSAAGARAFPGPVTLYVSEDAHRAWFKIAHQAGIGRDTVRLVRTDGGRLDPRDLRDRIRADRDEGRVPVMIAATAGTTNAGMIDPLAVCADIAREMDLWYHVDAAWGGALIASERYAGNLAGIERAHSVTIDAHKWFATTMGCGMFFTSLPDLLPSAFEVTTGYMPSRSSGLDPYVTSIQWSRRFLGLRLFLSLAAAGWDGYARHVERALGLAAVLKEELCGRGWRVVNDSKLAVVCAQPPQGSANIRDIVARILGSGRAWVSAAMFEGREVVRACITNGETSREDVLGLVESLEASR